MTTLTIQMGGHLYSKCGLGFALAQSIKKLFCVGTLFMCTFHFWENFVKNSFIPKIG